MINLMPPERKEAIRFARLNALLIKWIVGIGLAAAGLALVVAGSLFYLRQDASSLSESIADTNTFLTSEKESEVIKRAEEMSGNLKLTVDVLSNEVLFSELLQKIGLVMPSGTVLEDLSLTNELASAGIDLQIGARDYETGARAHVNLNDPNNGIFEKADLIEISCPQGEDRSPTYPCVARIRALFVKDDNPFLLINRSGSTR